MATDLGLVAHTTQGHANELAAGGTCHRLTQRGLADARRANQAQDRCLDLVDALLHREILKDAVLDLVEAVMIFIQHRLGAGQVVLDLGLLAPGQIDQGLDVVAHHRCFGRHRRHQLELLQLAVGLLARFLGHAGGLDLLVQVFEVGTLFAVAQFLLDRLDLLVQVVLALALLHLALDAATDALFHLQDVDLVLEQIEQLFQPLAHLGQIQHRLLGIELQRQMRSDGVSQATRIVDTADGRQDLGRDLLVQLDVLVELLGHRAPQGFDLGLGVDFGRDRQHLGNEMLFGLGDAVGRGTLQAFDQHLDRAVGQFQHLQDAGNAADLEHIVGLGLVLAGGLLGHQHDLTTCFHRGFQGLDGLGATHEQRNHHMRKHHHVAQRQQGQGDGFGGQNGMTGHENLSFSSPFAA